MHPGVRMTAGPICYTLIVNVIRSLIGTQLRSMTGFLQKHFSLSADVAIRMPFLHLSIVFFVLFAFSTPLIVAHINTPPSHRHGWGQADYYAMAIKFSEIGSNIFLPRSFVFNAAYDANADPMAVSDILGTDFPLHPYAVGTLYRLTGVVLPGYYRLYTLLWGIVGLTAFFAICRRFLSDVILSFSLTAAYFSAPVFAYHVTGFLPTIATFAQVMIGYALFFSYSSNQRFAILAGALFFFTLAATSRTACFIFLASVGCQLLLSTKRSDRTFVPAMVLYGLSLTVFFSYFLYGEYIHHTYGSFFFRDIRPARDIEEFFTLTALVIAKFFRTSFTPAHYLFFVFLSLACKQSFALGVRTKHVISLHAQTGLLLAACLAFSIAMLRQLPQHDYYFLDVQLPIFFLATICIASVFRPSLSSVFKKVICLSLAVLCVICGVAQRDRYARTSVGTDAEVAAFDGADIFLNSLGFPASARPLVLGVLAPNIALTEMRRQGYVLNEASRVNGIDFEQALRSYDPDFVVLMNDRADAYIGMHSDTFGSLKRMATNGNVTVYVPLR